MADLALIETGNGGDLILAGNDLSVVQGYENMPYLSMFGGRSWWGNLLMRGDDPATMFSAQTEKVMMGSALNSAGRIRIENAIKADLAHLVKNVPVTKITVSTSISNDRLEINITIDGQPFYYQWNPAAGFLTYRV